MVELIVVRHAIAFERDVRRWRDDRARPLTPEGKRKFRKAAAGLRGWMPQVDLLLTSPLVRARQTAEILTAMTGWPAAAERSELEPSVDPQTTLASLRQPRVARVAIVGHEPHLSSLVGLCVSQADATLHLELKKGTVVLIRFAEVLRAGSGTLAAVVPPRALRRMA